MAFTAAAQDPDATIYVGSLDEAPEPGQHRLEAGRASPRPSTATCTRASSASPTRDVEPLLAEDYTVSEDGLVYTFTLKPGVTFHSGKPLTSEDVKFSIERVFAEELKRLAGRASGPSPASRRPPPTPWW